jgi:hypothetical protein
MPHVLEAELADARVVQQRHEHGRHPGKVGRTELLDRRQHLLGIVLRMEDLQRAHPQSGHHADRERIDVEIRDDDEVTLLAAEHVHGVGPPDRLHDVGEDVPVAEHRALRRAGGAARVLEDREVVRRDVDDWGSDPGLSRV